ncbi:hypothetical protein [Fibrella forsythiae]|uniref:SpoVG family protein n=1 Tax=Fibrella forsythiae TaxID=2817061 RepID=A0ABS3JE52_9BACT|nr:hypothetical protein [Fibrella forsythiae]MBO0947549.1 hypothetical protein [Fibrella forsythiae]
MNTPTQKPVELHAIIELFGHQKMAGKVSEYQLGGNFIRIDVPETSTQGAYCRIVNPSAVYAINPVTEEVAKGMAEHLQTKPIEAWDISTMQRKLLALKNATNEPADEDPQDEGDYYERM